MHRTQVLLEEHQYRMLRATSLRTGRSIGDLVREAITAKYSDGTAGELREAMRASFGAWSSRNVDGLEYVEQIREGVGDRLRELGWE